MITQGVEFYVFLVILMGALVLASIVIPCYGFLHKDWKGLALVCVIQPFVAGIACLLVGLGAYFYYTYNYNRYHESAMVTVRKTTIEGADTLTRTWYLNADEECLYEFRSSNQECADSTVREDDGLFDVVPLDSITLGVEEHVIVRFDLNTRTVTATDDDEPIDVVSVDWPKVEAYLSLKQSNKHRIE